MDSAVSPGAPNRKQPWTSTPALRASVAKRRIVSTSTPFLMASSMAGSPLSKPVQTVLRPERRHISRVS